jgi:hypothetical protein
MLFAIHPDHDTYHRLTFFSDGMLRIERPWCCLILRVEMQDLEEKAYPHRWLIWKLQEANGERSFWKPDSAPTDSEQETEAQGETQAEGESTD